MLRLQPLSRPVGLQAGAVGQYVQRTGRHRGRLDHRQRHGATADPGVIRCRERQAHQRQHRCHQAFGLPQRQLERRAQHQAGLNSRVRTASLPALSKALPVFQRAVLNPQRQAATPAQACLIGRPVLHLERHLRDGVEIDEVYVVAGHKGQPEQVAKRGGSGAVASWQERRDAARWRRTSRPSLA